MNCVIMEDSFVQLKVMSNTLLKRCVHTVSMEIFEKRHKIYRFCCKLARKQYVQLYETNEI